MNPHYQLFVNEEYLGIDATRTLEKQALDTTFKTAEKTAIQEPAIEEAIAIEKEVSEPIATDTTSTDTALQEKIAMMEKYESDLAYKEPIDAHRLEEAKSVYDSPTLIKSLEPIDVKTLDPCATVRCAKGYTCRDGRCVRDFADIQYVEPYLQDPAILIKEAPVTDTTTTESTTTTTGDTTTTTSGGTTSGGTTINIFGEGTSTTTSSGGVSVDTSTGDVTTTATDPNAATTPKSTSSAPRGGGGGGGGMPSSKKKAKGKPQTKKVGIKPKKKDYLPLILLGTAVGLMIFKPFK